MILDENIRTNKRPNNSGDKVAAGKFKNCIMQPPMYWKNEEVKKQIGLMTKFSPASCFFEHKLLK